MTYYAVLLGLVFALLVGFNPAGIVAGLGLSFLVLWLLPQHPRGGKITIGHLKCAPRFVRNFTIFFADFLWDLTLSNIQIAWDVWTPRDYYSPKIVEVPVDDLSDFQKALLATRITLTPGTLSADLTANKATLIVHVMYPKTDGQVESLRRPIEILLRGLR